MACLTNALFTVSGPSDLMSPMSSLKASFSLSDKPFFAAVVFKLFRRLSNSTVSLLGGVGVLFDSFRAFLVFFIFTPSGGDGGFGGDGVVSISFSGGGFAFFVVGSLASAPRLEGLLVPFGGSVDDDDAPGLYTSSSAFFNLFAADSSFSVGTTVSCLALTFRTLAMGLGFVATLF